MDNESTDEELVSNLISATKLDKIKWAETNSGYTGELGNYIFHLNEGLTIIPFARQPYWLLVFDRRQLLNSTGRVVKKPTRELRKLVKSAQVGATPLVKTRISNDAFRI